MKITINSAGLQDWSGSVLLIGLTEGDFNQQLNDLGQLANKELLLDHLKKQNFKANPGEIFSCHLLTSDAIKLIFIGLGKLEKLELKDIRQAASLGVRASVGFTGKLGVILPWHQFDANSIATATGEACRLAIFKDLRFRSIKDQKKFPAQIELIGLTGSTNHTIKKIESICAGVELARELVGAPPNSLTPSELANQALQVAKEHNLEAKVLEKKECKELGMGSYLAVAQGSDLDPKFIHLTYRPKSSCKNRIVMVGKGLTFDSGGYNLKVGASQIEKMKYDMGGSAAVIGAARAIGEIRPANTEIHFIVAACENMINGSALHPGDIVTASNGKTIEVNNTDAEGRLTLADALVYSCELKPDAIVDLATLTGACVIALGDEIAGLWTESDQLAHELTAAANSVGEGIWRMPMQNSYKEGLKSMLADLQNTGPRAGGSITAALFLKEFVNDSIQWAHIDIAGTCWTDKDKGINPAGATGYGVRTLVEWACKESF
tara:strand:+ start:8201 stop:9679 length:1479 start_codon:yes stop_codon:yes gene_type:complete